MRTAGSCAGNRSPARNSRRRVLRGQEGWHAVVVTRTPRASPAEGLRGHEAARRGHTHDHFDLALLASAAEWTRRSAWCQDDHHRLAMYVSTGLWHRSWGAVAERHRGNRMGWVIPWAVCRDSRNFRALSRAVLASYESWQR